MATTSSSSQLVSTSKESGPPMSIQKSLHRISLHPTLSPFRRRAYRTLLSIPAGRWTTYSAMAKYLGSSSRAVGGAMRTNPWAPDVPCHRVLSSTKEIGGYKGDWSKQVENGSLQDEKRNRLREEGVDFDENGKVLGECFTGFEELGKKTR